MTDTLNPIRILAVNFHGLIQDAMSALVDGQAEGTILPPRVTCETALSVIPSGHSGPMLPAQMPPDLLLFDLDNCPHRRLECLNSLRLGAPAARVLALAGTHDIMLFRTAIGRGAHGVLLKTDPAATLMEAIRQIHRGQIWLSHEIACQLIPEPGFASHSLSDEAEAANISLLSKREREVLALLAGGFKDQQIADRLGISIATVRSHLTSIHLKLDIKDRMELAVYSHRHGLTEAPLPASTNRGNLGDLGKGFGEGDVSKVQRAKPYVAHRKLA